MTRKLSHFVVAALAVLTVLAVTKNAQAASEKVLYSFAGGSDGGGPASSLIFDSAGNLYGTTQQGGAGFGTVFELSPSSGGTWTEKVLYSFLGGADGNIPVGGVLFDKSGNLYGTTAEGGAPNMGTVFKLTPAGGGSWTESVIYAFTGPDGSLPTANLVFDSAGNLYSTTADGGVTGNGTVFELVSNPGGSWSEKVLFSFPQNFPYGADPAAGVTFDSFGNLYGTTLYGGQKGSGQKGSGNVFELSPSGSSWIIKNLHTFAGSPDGQYPDGSVIFDSAENLYSTTSAGGAAACSCGTVFRLTPSTGGHWTERIMHSFADTPGKGLYSGLVLDSANNLYGTTAYDENNFNGTVFKLSLNTGLLSTIYTFSGPDGSDPNGVLIFDSTGSLYGTTVLGGPLGNGTVFEITP